MEAMATSVKAVVKDGRLVVNEPTDLPEGTVVELEPVFDIEDEAERARLQAVIDESRTELAAGKGIPLDAALDHLKSIR